MHIRATDVNCRMPKNNRSSNISKAQQQQQQQQTRGRGSNDENDNYQNNDEYTPSSGQPKNRIVLNNKKSRRGQGNAQYQAQPQYQPQLSHDSYGQIPSQHQSSTPHAGAYGGGSGGGVGSGGGGGGVVVAGYGELPAEALVPADDGPQQQCPDCGRKFNPIPFQKHIKICSKVFMQKRKTFDSMKMRVKDDPELAKAAAQAKKDEARQNRAAARGAAKAPTEKPIQAKGTGGGGGGAGGGEKWRNQSEAFREAMRAARQVTKAIASGAPLPPPVASAPDPSLVPCPHCGRRFNAKAADRHIPQCQNIKAKPSRLQRGAGGGGGVNGKMAAAKSKRGFMG